MSWSGLFRRANHYAQAKAQAELDAHADPKVQLEQAIGSLQEHHRDLEAAASHVIAQERLAKMRLSNLSGQEARYTASAVAAQQQGNLDAARSFALRIASLREQIQTLAGQVPQLERAANDARQAVQESSDQLQQTLSERSAILSQIDQANMSREVAASAQAVSDLAGGDVPSLDEIRDKVAAQFAQAQAQAELSSTSPAIQEMHVRHQELTAEADSILAQLGAGTLAPALGQPAPDTARAPKGISASPA